MPNSLLTVVVSAGQSRNPEKRSLEKAIAESAATVDGVNVVQIPHLYDIAPAGPSFELLKQIDTDLVVCSWLFDRAAHWVLDRNGVRGQVGEVELRSDLDEEVDTEPDEATDERVIESQPRPDRRIYNLDFRTSPSAADFEQEIRRIRSLLSDSADTESNLVEEVNENTGNGNPNAALDATAESASRQLGKDTMRRFESPTNDTYVGANPNPVAGSESDATVGTGLERSAATLFGSTGLATVDEHPGRRWYPVIDFSRCTNCMECIDFCLFGVYGVDNLETIVVEQADNCRKGCPACSRVCPQNAIIFPQHKTPAIAGAPVDTGGLKIDLSKLFGAPEADEDPAEVAARERDEQLILAGREAVGTGSAVSERLAEKKATQAPGSDEFDGLLDELDALDL